MGVPPTKGISSSTSLNLDNIAADKIRIERANLMVGNKNDGLVRKKSSIIMEAEEDEHMEKENIDKLNKDPIRPFNKFEYDAK